ncbi:hypothetical protein EYZ11_003879 [Aspergillus tanneri]|uniref:Serine hydrolase FSH domain-containing protein n=1 Tax=Aspergillus tanneri TaxID=1220188 RepID=A0A4S3JLX9_9EURO|nr:uncharacterized protein ATNIH1004_009367 [Aspergillus tanneri]KAA8645150.1 hypothetical protein ATNIH1004_009367 [Aspergillus tanneri]THC96629.1 hypothetical protein EYZ11_003879 [Aspergillus tanneri]
MVRSLPIVALALFSATASLACVGSSDKAADNVLPDTSDGAAAITHRLTDAPLECRCGMSQFLTLPHANITPPEEAKHCARYKLIDARGTAEPQGVSTMFYPMIQNILANMTGGVSLPVEYPAGPDQNTTSGEDFVIDNITEGLLSCPDQKYALFGYSQGATLMLNVLAELSPSALRSVTSVILVGNPYRIPGKMSNVDGAAQPDKRVSVGMFAEPALASNSTIPQLSTEVDRSGKVLDYCLEIAAGHLSYGLVDTVQETAFGHVVKQFRSVLN